MQRFGERHSQKGSFILRAVEDFMRHHNLEQHTPIISSGAAMYLHGLRDGINDIDLYIPTMRQQRLASMHHGIRVEAFNEWPGIDPDTAYEESVGMHGARLMSRPQLLSSYMALNRPKDQPHIALLMKQPDALADRASDVLKMKKMAETLFRLVFP